MRRVNISLDSLKPERFAYITGVDAFDKVMRSIEKAKQAGLHPVKINTVIIKGFNDDEVLDFADFARRSEVQVRFIEFMPFGDESLWDRSRILSSASLEEEIRRVHDLHPSVNSDKGPAKMFLINGSAGQVGFISPMSTHICHECNRIRLTPDGKIKPCLFSDTEYDVKALIRGGASDDDGGGVREKRGKGEAGEEGGGGRDQEVPEEHEAYRRMRGNFEFLMLGMHLTQVGAHNGRVEEWKIGRVEKSEKQPSILPPFVRRMTDK